MSERDEIEAIKARLRAEEAAKKLEARVKSQRIANEQHAQGYQQHEERYRARLTEIARQELVDEKQKIEYEEFKPAIEILRNVWLRNLNNPQYTFDRSKNNRTLTVHLIHFTHGNHKLEISAEKTGEQFLFNCKKSRFKIYNERTETENGHNINRKEMWVPVSSTSWTLTEFDRRFEAEFKQLNTDDTGELTEAFNEFANSALDATYEGIGKFFSWAGRKITGKKNSPPENDGPR